MEFKVDVNANDCVIVATVSGDVTASDIKSTVTELNKIVTAEGITQILCDYRKASSKMSIFDIYNLPQELLDAGASYSHTVALVYSADSVNISNISFFDTRCINSNLPVTLFTNYDEAYKWLASDRL